MKKIVMLLLIALCSSPAVMAQSIDDLYYVPKKEDPQAKKAESRKDYRDRTSVSSGVPVVVKDRNGKTRNADEYNRRYDSSNNNFEVKNDTLYVEEQDNNERGRWVNGFNGSTDDYEYAQRIIRFRNPRFAVSISSPYYWDIMYNTNSWDWNVYTDDYNVYAFPTFTNRLWWDWRYGSRGSFGIGYGWSSPYYSGYYGNYYGGGFYDSAWGYPYYGGGYYGSGYGSHSYYGRGSYANNTYYNDRSSRYPSSYSRPGSSVRLSESYRGNSYAGSSRVVGSRPEGYSSSRRVNEYVRSSSTRSSSGEWDNSRRTTYTRPSSTRYSSESDSRRTTNSGYYREPEVRSGSYNRGGSSSSNSYNSSGTSRRTTYETSTPTRETYTPSSRSSESYRSSGNSSNSGGGGASRSRR